MEYYKLEFLDCPVDESDKWRSKLLKDCPLCKKKFVFFESEFAVATDYLDIFDAETIYEELPPIFEVAGIMVVESNFLDKIIDAQIKGVVGQRARISYLDESYEFIGEINNYYFSQ